MEKYVFPLVTPQPLFDLFASACNVQKTLFTKKKKNDWEGEVVRENKSHLQISVLDLPLLKMAHKS